MPGSIKIDDGSGNYTILTNAGSLGSDKTITIPNETGTLNLQSGSVLQVVQGTDNSAANITATTYQPTGLSASITPSSTSNKILVIVSHSAFAYAPGAIPFAYLQLLRDSTVLTDDYPLGMKAALHGDGNAYLGTTQNISYLDSPNSTSSLTYKTEGKYAGSGAGYLTTAYSDAVESIVLIEVGG
jgi:hypothetical protein